jgi:hypothetical protein
MKGLPVAAFLFIAAAAFPAAAGEAPLGTGLGRLAAAIGELGAPRAGEVDSERAELVRVLSGLQRRAAAIAPEIAAVESEGRALDRLGRDRDARLAKVGRDQSEYDRDLADLMRRGKIHAVDAKAQHAAAAAARTPAEVASSNAWSERVDARRKSLQGEKRQLDVRLNAIGRERSEIAAGIAAHTQRLRRLEKRRSLVDRETARLLGECASAQMRALALKQILDSPARPLDYQSADRLAEKAVSGVLLSIAKESALKGLETKAMLKALAHVGLKGHPVGLVYSVNDVFLDVATVGVDQQTREVTRNLFLIGDYGAAMKRMVREKGGAAVQSPEYRAMRAELERIASEMPSNEGQILMRGLGSSAAFGTALVAAAGKYASIRVERYAGKFTNHLNNAQRATLGKGGVTFYRRSFRILGSVAGEDVVKKSAEEIADSVRAAREAGSSSRR